MTMEEIIYIEIPELSEFTFLHKGNVWEGKDVLIDGEFEDDKVKMEKQEGLGKQVMTAIITLNPMA